MGSFMTQTKKKLNYLVNKFAAVSSDENLSPRCRARRAEFEHQVAMSKLQQNEHLAICISAEHDGLSLINALFETIS